MKRCLLAIVALVVVNCGLASADYVIVKIDLNQLLHPEKAPQGGVAGGFAGPGQVMPPGNFGGKGGFGGKKGGGGVPPGFPPQYQPGLAGGQPVMPGGAAQPSGPKMPPLYVYAYMELKSYKVVYAADKNVPFNILEIDCKLGNQKLKLYVPETALSSQTPHDLMFVKHQVVNRKFADKFKEELKENNDEAKKKAALALGEWALQRGLVTEFNTTIDELKKFDAKNPVVATVEKTRQLLKKKPDQDDPAAAALIADLRKEAYRPIVSDEGHYTLYTNVPPSGADDGELKRKLSKLEEVYSTFFYWYALKGPARTPPLHRLVVVLVDEPKGINANFLRKHAQFNFLPLVGGGFTAQHDNVVFLAQDRMDDAYDKLMQFNQAKMEEYQIDQETLLTKVADVFKSPAIQQSQQAGKSPIALLAILQSLAVCQKAMKDESELHAMTHGAARQLLSASGLMPRSVDTAEWARFGMAAYFEASPQSFFPSNGAASWTHLIDFKALSASKLLERREARNILIKVISDDYFRQASKAQQLAELGKDDPQAKQKALEKQDLARATSWALTYYLAQKKHTQLERYFEELRNLPRDLGYDSKVLRDCFYRAFGLLKDDPNQPGHPIPDIVKIDNMAADWFNVIEKTRLDYPQYEILALKWRTDELRAAHTQPPPGNVQPGTSSQPGITGDPTGVPPVGGTTPPPTGTTPPPPPGKGGGG